jgi:hypothetical protein
MIVLAANPKYLKISVEEKARQKSVCEALRPGLVLEYIVSDYHEEDSTPVGFHSIGDRLELQRIVEVKPIVDSKTREKVREYNVWLVKGRWGEHTKDELYLARMMKVAESGG